MKRQDYIQLYKKYLQGKCTPEEWELLNAYEDAPGLEDTPWDAEIGDEQEVENRIFNNITEGIAREVTIRKIRIRWLSVAASLLIFATAAGLYFLTPGRKATHLVGNKVPPAAVKDILPGGNRAILTLASGAKIALNSTKDGVITRQGRAAVNKTQNGQLVYKTSGGHNDDDGLDVVYNTVTTPRGGEYQIVLTDGTKAWLNAASSLKFPTAFTGSTRHVEITGEVYFEVAKNKKMPFIVSSNGAEVEVLGTHFDVMAYNDEPEVRATLLEGSVKFRKNKEEVLLTPGEQAVSSYATNRIKVQKANISETMAWRDGYFVFQDENIQSIMRKISRWYDVEVVYQGNMAEREYGGKVSRYKNMSDVLNSLELTGTIHFKVEGRRVTVML